MPRTGVVVFVKPVKLLSEWPKNEGSSMKVRGGAAWTEGGVWALRSQSRMFPADIIYQRLSKPRGR